MRKKKNEKNKDFVSTNMQNIIYSVNRRKERFAQLGAYEIEFINDILIEFINYNKHKNGEKKLSHNHYESRNRTQS